MALVLETGCSMTGNDPLFWNKAALAVLLAIALLWVTNALVGALYHSKHLEKDAFVIAAEEPGEKAGAATGEAAKPEAPKSAVALLADADAEKGKKVARKCAACHSFEKGGPNKVGPNLWNIVGADKAHAEGYSYSGAFKGLEGTWDYAALDNFLRDPRGTVKGTKMSFAGVAKADDRADLIAYMRTLSENPKPLP
jgi:cytochrome c